MRHQLELRQLRTFLAVVDGGSYTRAARALECSQSTVSETMAALERAVGVTLLERGRHGARPTPAGQIVLDHAQRMCDLALELETALASASDVARASLSIAAVESVGAYLLPARWQRLRTRWPQLRIEVFPGSCGEIRAAVAAGRVDVGFVLETAADPRGAEELATKRLSLVGLPGHPLAGRRASPRELAAHDFLLCDAGGDYNEALRALFVGSGLPLPRQQSLGTIEGVKQGLAAEPDAIALLPEHAVDAELRARSLVELTTAPALPRLALRAVVAPAAARSPILAELLESLRDVPPGAAR